MQLGLCFLPYKQRKGTLSFSLSAALCVHRTRSVGSWEWFSGPRNREHDDPYTGLWMAFSLAIMYYCLCVAGLRCAGFYHLQLSMLFLLRIRQRHGQDREFLGFSLSSHNIIGGVRGKVLRRVLVTTNRLFSNQYLLGRCAVRLMVV